MGLDGKYYNYRGCIEPSVDGWKIVLTILVNISNRGNSIKNTHHVCRYYALPFEQNVIS